jgi:dipeptidyl aminopeptidase/acylaminoacyl peptidase
MEDMFMDPFGGEPEGVTEELVRSVIAALDNPEFRAQISPIYYLDRTQAPVSIHVGTADKVTPKEWSRAIRDVLNSAGKEVEYFDYQGQGHSIGGSALADFYGQMTDFYDRNLK